MSDDFDYTRVQHEPCPICAHDTSSIPAPDLAPALAEVARQWRDFVSAVLDYPGGADDLTVRPRDDVWSAVEYACHVRDVLSLFARRVELTLLADRPELTWWDHEAAVEDEYYAQQDPQGVSDDIVVAAAELSRMFQTLSADQRAREATRLGEPFTVEGLVRFAVHEAVHHLEDARKVVPAPA